MHSARRTITSGSRVREVDLYSGFNKNIVNLYDGSVNEDEAYQNALKVSSYGKRNTTPKTNWVKLVIKSFRVDSNRFNLDQREIANRGSPINSNDSSSTIYRHPTSWVLFGKFDV